MNIISLEELKSKYDKKENFLLLDVRTPIEYEEFHVPIAVNLPLDNISKAEVEKLAQGRPVIAICKAGGRSRKACEILINSGFSDIATVDVGSDAWKNSGFPIKESGNCVMSLERQVRIAAGIIILSGILLGYSFNNLFYLLSASAGLGLIISGVTNSCCMGLILAKMPWNKCNNSFSTCQKN